MTTQVFAIFLLIFQVFAYFDDDADLKNCVAQTIENVFGHEKTLMFVTDVGGNFAFPDVIQNPYAIINTKFSNLDNVSSFISNDINLVMHYLPTMKFSPNYKHFPKKITLLFIIPINNADHIGNTFKRLWRDGYENFVVIVYGTSYKPTILYSDPYAIVNRCKEEVEYLITGDCTKKAKYPFKKIQLGKYPYCNLYMNISQGLIKAQNKLSRISRFGTILEMTLKYLNLSFVSTIVSNDSTFTLEQGSINIFHPNQRAFVLYFQDSANYIVPPPVLISPLIVLKIVFKPLVWILVFVVFVCSSLAWWLFDKYYTKQTSSAIFNVYSITVLGSVDKVPLQPPLRIIFIAYVIYSIHVQTAFTSNLVQFFTVPQYEPHIQTLEDLADSKLSIITNDDIYKFVRNGEYLSPLYSTIFNKFQVSNFTVITDALFYNKFDDKCVFLDADRLNGITLFSENILYYFIDNRFSSYFVYVFSSKYPSNFFNSFENLVQMLNENGDFDRSYKRFKAQSQVYRRYRNKAYFNQTITEDKVVISLEHVCSPFAIWGLGLFLALLVFILEVVIYKCNRLKMKNKENLTIAFCDI
ncbi:hypothetical protein FQR65_LT15130 [Abscondita terminalis]|nr:hypothetical protein FQR65_LT15130 [Abscondita terminalis]